MEYLLPTISAQLDGIYQSLAFLIPEIFISLLFLCLLIFDLIFGRKSEWLCRLLCLGGLALVFYSDLQQLSLVRNSSQFLFNNMLLLHHVGVLFKLILDALLFLIVLYVPLDHKLQSESKGLSTMYVIMIAVLLGLHMMVMAVNLLMIYLAIEMVSLGSYILVAYRTQNLKSSESGIKYFIFGAISSAMMLYGLTLLYGFSGTLHIFDEQFIVNLKEVNVISLSFCICLIMAGIGFKLSFVPMHFWTPDIYEGADTPVTSFLSTLPKIAGFALLINFLTPFIFLNEGSFFDFKLFLSVIAICTMIVGNFAAVFQNNIKRLLAYSAIGHTGFALMALVTFTEQGLSALLFYLLVYGVVNLGAFMLASYYANIIGSEHIDDYKGLGVKYPLAGVCFVILLISLTGLPVSAGFAAKVLVFSSVLDVYNQTSSSWLMALLITGAVTTVVSLFYYFKILLNLFLKKTEKSFTYHQQSPFLLIIIGLTAVFALFFGIYPDLLSQFLI
jgi:NADH-quinone oxidoreductase subunit N